MSMNTNLPASDMLTVAAAISPKAINAPISTGWVDFGVFKNMMAIITAGTITSINAKLEQAINDQDNAESKVIDVPGKVITALTASDKQVIINAHHGDMKMAEDYRYIRLTLDGDGLAGAVLMGVMASYGPAGKQKSVDLVEIV